MLLYIMYIAHACAQCTFREFCDTRHRNAAPAWRSMLFFGPYRFWRIILNVQNVNYSYRFYRRFEISRKRSIYTRVKAATKNSGVRFGCNKLYFFPSNLGWEGSRIPGLAHFCTIFRSQNCLITCLIDECVLDFIDTSLLAV